MSHPRNRRVLAAAALLATGVSTTGCTKTVAGGLAHHLEPGLGANFSVTNHTNSTLTVQERAQGPNEPLKPYNPVTDGTYTIPSGQTVYLADVFLAANDCAGYTLLAYVGTHVIARHASPLCVNNKAVGGWTITTS